MKWLRAVSCGNDLDILTRERIQGSCEWFLERKQYQTWKSPNYSAGRPEVLWCYGGPGVGKTYLSAKIVENLKTTTSLPVAFFFAAHGDERKREPLSIIGSWIYQLALQRASVFERLKSSYESKNDEVITETELWDLFSFSISAADRCYLLVDGFDELTTERGQRRSRIMGAREALLNTLFGQLSGTVNEAHVHLAVISREESDIKRRVFNAQQLELATIHTYGFDSNDNAKDLLSFCQRLIDQAVGDMDQSVKTELAEKLAERSDGMMLWAYLTSQELHPGRTKSQLLEDILETPKGLNHAYMRDLRRIEKLGQKMRERATEILRWTLFALQPLSVIQITDALLVDTENMALDVKNRPTPINYKYIESQLLGLVGSLVRYRPRAGYGVPGEGFIELSHFSVKEFLLGKTNTSEIQFRRRDCHGQLAMVCFTYLVWEEFDDTRFRRNVLSCSRDEVKTSRLLAQHTDKASLFFYCRHWSSHARASLSLASSI